MASTDARPVPRKNVAYRVYFPILDADGDLVTGASSLDSEVSLDGGSFSDCTNEATEIGSTGVYYLDLTSGEMNADAVCVIVKTGTAGAKTTPIFFYPEEAGDFRADVTHFGGSAGTFSSGRPEVNASHLGGNLFTVTTGSVATDGGNSATSFKTDLAQTTNNYWVDAFVVLTSGTMAGQVKRITAYNGTTKFLTVSSGFTATPADGVTFTIVNR